MSNRLNPEGKINLSIIDPFEYNIHEIKAIKTSGFIDLMMPHYPEDTCQSFEMIGEEQEMIKLKRLPETYTEKLIPFNKFLK